MNDEGVIIQICLVGLCIYIYIYIERDYYCNNLNKLKKYYSSTKLYKLICKLNYILCSKVISGC